KIPQARKVILAVRVDEGVDLGELLVGLVMVDDDDVDSHPASYGKGLEAGGAAIQGHDQLGAFGYEALDRGDVRAVGLERAIRNLGAAAEAVGGEEPCEQGDARRAVHIVTAEKRDALAGYDGVGQPNGRFVYVRQHARV